MKINFLKIYIKIRRVSFLNVPSLIVLRTLPVTSLRASRPDNRCFYRHVCGVSIVCIYGSGRKELSTLVVTGTVER